ncbi:Metallo-beta-lactamase family protein [Rhodovulum sp. P5]|uniref:MBL fold metallo-hydrolase n=1 Tax=Rhodovulum sp. P5 TaxID=1564506 RepID=UPI0009C31805|nr:MBL fold metallo-hydrolase [Rhodovulum sp. P5]ARE39227.1 Metallo-beta-lactamase family protein [Rhodovulum sp. P5]
MPAPPPFDPTPGIVETLRPGLRRVLAPNPSPMTFRGTNTYVLGQGTVAIIDPGPDMPAHRQALLAALGPGERVSHILVTHSHLDHSPLARPLSDLTGAPVLAFGDSAAGRRADLADIPGLGGGEGIDAGFVPDILLGDGDVIDGAGWQVTALHTPGHMGNHMCFAWEDAMFTGDHVMGWASSMVSPPDGDLGAFMRSLQKLAARSENAYFPAHGAPVANGPERVADLLAHRKNREAQIVAALADAPATAEALTERIYIDTPRALLPAATRNVLAHLIDLKDKEAVEAVGPLGADTAWART